VGPFLGAIPVILRNKRLLLALAAGTAISIPVITAFSPVRWMLDAQRLLLAPMIAVVEPCIFARTPTKPVPPDDLDLTCTRPEGSAAPLVESTLSELATRTQGPGWELGYTLPVPLLRLFHQQDGQWVLDQGAIGRYVRTLRDSPRPAILYLFSTHFSQHAPIEDPLQADPRNLSETPEGPLGTDKYYGDNIYNWSFATTDNEITRRRVQAIEGLAAEICKLGPEHVAKIRGVTLLGELHHLFPRFQDGMGFAPPYRVTDYSEASRRGFRAFLRKRYGTIAALNAELGTKWASFAQVEPPSKDVRTTPLKDFTEHLDSYAHGTVPITGWAYVPRRAGDPRPLIRIYRNGEPIGSTPVRLGRQDVLEAMPGFADADVGWRFDLDFRRLPPGLHQVDILLEDKPGSLVHVGTRRLGVMDWSQQPPQPMPQRPLPASRPPGGAVKTYVDLPTDYSSYYYNPLAPLWHEFRGQQVVSYLEHFAAVVQSTCLGATGIYTHQINPHSNPGWDENKYAVDASLKKLPGLNLGISLYGEPTYGDSFLERLQFEHHVRYGITEFHPLKAMKADEVRQMLDAHAHRGASFVSFFLEPRWHGKLMVRNHNLFSFDPDNPRYGSARLYQSIKEVLAGPAPGAR
jgi:hypothetical protein